MHRAARFRLVVARACVLGGVATAFGAIGHLHAGGGDPRTLGVVAVWLAASALSALFLIAEAGWVRITALLLGEQLLVHTGLMWMASAGSSMPPMPDMPSMPGMGPMPTAAPMGMVPSGGMIAAHGLAALVAGLWLWRGERTLWALLALAGTSLRVIAGYVAIAPATPPAFVDLRWGTTGASPWDPRIAREVPRRGPPRAAAF